MLPTAYSNTLIIGTSAQDPPFSSSADKKNHFFGFEIELMTKICMHIKAQCKFTPLIASQILTELATGKIDLAVDAVIIPSNEQEIGILFSLPYLPSSAQFITKKQSPINTLNDIRHKRVGVRLGTLAHGTMFRDYVSKMYNTQVEMSSYLTMNDLLNALMNDEIDVAFSNTEPVKYWYMNNSAIFKLVGRRFPIGNGYAVMGKAGQEELMAQINKAINQIEKDGTYERVYNRYFDL